jgi:hypothetical protein
MQGSKEGLRINCGKNWAPMVLEQMDWMWESMSGKICSPDKRTACGFKAQSALVQCLLVAPQQAAHRVGGGGGKNAGARLLSAAFLNKF